jgi:hypothetical protein
MAWNDKATPAQIGATLNLMRWSLTRAQEAWAKERLENATRAQISREMKRLRQLTIEHRLTDENVFDGEIWRPGNE